MSEGYKYRVGQEVEDLKLVGRSPSRSPSPEKDSIKQPKDPRSKAKYNIFSRLFFFWLDPLFCFGCRHDLNQSDLYAHPDEADSEKLNKQFNIYWRQELERKSLGKKPRLWVVFFKSFKWRFLLQALLAFIEVAMLIGQSVLLGILVDYFTEVSSGQVQSDCFGVEPLVQYSSTDAYLAAMGLLLLALSVAMLHAHYALISTKIGMMARIMTTSAIYNKMLVLSQSTISEITTGHVINVVSNDVQRFDLAFLFFPYLWIAPLHIIVFTYLVYQEVGWVVFVTLFFFILQIPVQLALAKVFKAFREKSADITDKRVKIMNEVITGIRVIKMYAWEPAFKKLVSVMRRNEVHFIKIAGMIRTLISAFNFGVALTLFMSITFITFVCTGGELTPRRVILTLSLLTFLRNISASFLIRSVFLLVEAKVGVTRIQNILEKKELTSDEILAISQGAKLKERKKQGRKSRDSGLFRPESPWLSGLRKIDPPVEMTSYTVPKSDPASGDNNIAPSDGDSQNKSEHVTTPLEDGVQAEVGSPSPVAPPASTEPKAMPRALQNSVKVVDVTVSWSGSLEAPTISSISFEVNDQSPFFALVGKVGSGKSSLLQCLLGELKALRGNVEVNGRVSYASQTPWVFSGTIKDNILFGSEYNKERYNKVVNACCLRQDFRDLPKKDLTLVGERGVTLSGGQKARVNLARAVYHEADIYLLDDPLSAVDISVGKQIFEKCIRGLLSHNQVILVTHQVQFAMRADQLLLLNEAGECQFCRSQAELRAEGLDQHKLLKILKERNAEYVYDDHDQEENEEEEDLDGEADDEFPSLPPMSPVHKDSINERTYRGILLRQDSTDSRRFGNVEESITAFSRMRYTSQSKDDNLLSSIVEPGELNVDHEQSEDGEEKAHGTISMKTYARFFRAGGNYVILFIILILFFLAETGVVASDSWLSEWSNCAVINISIFEICNKSVKSICYLTEDQRKGIYGGITLASIVLNFLRTALFYLVCINASRVLHNRMFRALIRTSIRFFDTNPSGRVLNRFSKDIGFLDDLLPHTFLEYLFLLLRFLAVLVTASYGNPYVLIPATLILLGFLLLRWYFLKTSRDVKRLEAVARSPVYSHFSITLQGLSTIRSLGKQPVTQKLFHHYQNQHTQGWYLYLATSRWFGMRIDFVAALYLGVVSFISIPLAESLDAGIVGLGLAYTIALAATLQYCVRQSAEVENIMISTERIMAYGKLEPEGSLETVPPNLPPPDGWPQKGGLTLDHVQFRYDLSLPHVIKNLCFSVKSTEKIGIVGRTGAGKSTLISILFRLAEPQGVVEIDAVHVKTIGLHELRKKISIIPQDPFLFSGSVRYNLDPCEEYSDEMLWKALEQVQLKHEVEMMSGGLSAEVAEEGSNFSVGQKQLMCLARALLKKNKILVLDEATANVDPGTDEIIQETIRTSFKECTVLTIAHRLNTIMDSDRILVMNRGQVAEYDTPYNLLQQRSSMLYRMVEKTGPEASKELYAMARK